MPEVETRAERTGWRDLELSLRHRAFGWDVPAEDMDFMLIEYDGGQCVALIEHKRHTAQPSNYTHPTWKALIGLANKPPAVPCFEVRYKPGDGEGWDWIYWVTPLNDPAKRYFAGPGATEITEQEYIRILYRLRRWVIPAEPFPACPIKQRAWEIGHREEDADGR